MALIDIDFQPERDTLRRFGWIALAGFGLLAGLAWLEKGVFAFGLGSARAPLAAALAALGVLSALSSLLAPQANRWLWVGLSLLAFPIGFVISHVILAALFYLVLTPVGFVLRGLGKDPLERRMQPEADSYWVEARASRPKESYFKQF